MKDADAPEPDVEAVVAALGTTAKGLPDPVTRYLLVNNGESVVDDFLPGDLVVRLSPPREPTSSAVRLNAGISAWPRDHRPCSSCGCSSPS